ncbi:riboflavin synthase [Ammoniphilus sp. CFH 90114]|uniref:riboflavin synthase n=1 Tax=Ammoniphilus sp. CFH 90114 TaxID=2493665 RepID=UPI00100FBE63|nr:riboflavin synthase [Ammoniphilus sp. CFH 90114]RXT15231.1 riboflavin synthase [Ammoniphilus sp. CFH 90114]
MFTGIIEELGVIQGIKRGGEWMVLTIGASIVLKDVQLGDSIAVNGVCLTVTSFSSREFTVDVMPETFHKTSLSDIQVGSKVNLERAMAAGGRFGGHFVSGHVDGTGKIVSKTSYGNAVLFEIKAPEQLLHYMIPKGSVTIDGISLTILDVSSDRFSVSIIPHTLEMTILQHKGMGATVNLECDMIGKYIEKFITTRKPTSKLTEAFLSEHGFM